MTNKTKLSLVASFLIATQTFAETTQDMGTITVSSATKSEQSIKDVTSTVEVITKQELEAKNITTVTQALNQINGINFTSNGGLGTSTSVLLRGFDTKRTLVMIDGIRYNDVTGASGAPYEHLMITDIEKIEIIKGAQSGIWGADASAGVINIITKTPKKGTHGSLVAEYGSYNTKKYGASVSHATKKYSAKISYQKIDTDGFSAYKKKGTSLDDYEDDGYTNETSNIKFGYNFDDENKVQVSHTIIDAKSEIDSTSGDKDYYFNTTDTFSNIKFENSNKTSKNTIYANKSVFDREYVSTSTTKYDGEVNEYGINSKVSYGTDKDFIVVGVDYKDFTHENSIDETYINKGLFITNSNGIGDLVLTESIRSDEYTKFEDKTTGKVGAKYNFSKNLYVSTNIGTAYNIPTLYQLYSTYGNENLNPESTTSYEATIGTKTTKVTYFYNIVTDMIDYDTGVSKYNNIEGDSILKGWEFDYKNSITKDTLLSLNYTILDARDEDGYRLQRRPENTFKFSVDYFGIPKFHINLNGEYIGKRVEYSYGTYTVDANTGKYAIANLVVNYQVSNSIKTYLKVANIANRDYQVIDNYATSERAGYLGVKVSF